MLRIAVWTLFVVLLVGCAAPQPPTPSAVGSPTLAIPPPRTGAPTLAPSGLETSALHLVVFGDSIATQGAEPDATSYGHLFATVIERTTSIPVEVRILAADTTVDALAGLRVGGRLAAAVADADIIVVTTGANDVDPFAPHPAGTCAVGTTPAACLAAVSPDLAEHLGAILTRIRALTAGHPTAIRITSPDYNPFIGWTGAPTPTTGLDFYRQVAGAYTDLVCRLAPTVEAKCADFLHVFNGQDGSDDAKAFLEADHLHPSLAGRQRIADVLMAQGLEPLN